MNIITTDKNVCIVYQWLRGKESAYSAERHGDVGSIPGLGRSSGEGNGNPLQYSCLENPMDRGAWWATVHGVSKESDTTVRLNNNKTSRYNFIADITFFGFVKIISDLIN